MFELEERHKTRISSTLSRLHLRDGFVSVKAYGLKLVKRFARRCFPHQYEVHKRHKWRAENHYADVGEISTNQNNVDVKLGIIQEFANKHRSYIDACREIGVPYKVLDISGPNWIDVVRNCDCDAFLVRPSCDLSIWKHMFDERLKVMVEDLGKIIYPSYSELWFYESKRRMCYWLQAHDVPHPKTWIFYDCEEALAFARRTKLPMVFKSDFGAAASGVKIFRSRLQLMRWIQRCFRKGTIRRDEDPRDRQWGVVLLQEYVCNAKEWRMIRVGSSYFGRQKLRKGDFHSGSRLYGWYDPPHKLLEFTREITEKGKFTSMCVDVFENVGGEYYVNELQSLFGASQPHQMRVNGKPGRYIYDKQKAFWRFEEGEFNMNNSCNLRVQALLEMLKNGM